MNTLTKLVLIAALILSVLIPFGYFLLGQKKKSRYKKALGVNVFFFFGTLLIAAVVMLYPERVQGGFGLRQSIGRDRISGSGSFYWSFRHRRRNCRGQRRKRCSRRHQ